MNSFDYLLYPHLPHSKELLLPGGSFFVQVEQKDPFADNIKPISAYLRKYWLRLLCSPHVMRHALYFLEVLRKIRRLGSAEAVELALKNEEGIRKEADRFGIGMRQLDTIKRLWVPSFFYNTSRLENMKEYEVFLYL